MPLQITWTAFQGRDRDARERLYTDNMQARARPVVVVSSALARVNILAARLSSDTAACDIKVAPLKKFEEMPGVSTLPLIGPLLNFLPYIGTINLTNMYEFSKSLHDKYGAIVRMPAFLNQPNAVFTFDPNDFEQVLRNENTMPIRPGFEALRYFRRNVQKNKIQFSGSTGLITEHEEQWKVFRSAVNNVMLQPKTIKLYTAAIDEVALDMVKRLKRIRRPDNTIGDNIEVEMNKWALESIGLVGLGGRIGCLQDDLPKDSPAYELVQCVRDSFEVTDALDFKPSLWRQISTPMYRKAMRTFDRQLQLSEIFINKAITDLEKGDRVGKPDEENSILEKLLQIDDKLALLMASDMLFGGVDTAAHTMLSLLYNLATNPEKQNKLREEIRDGPERKYLKACTKENFRLYPVVALNARTTTKEHTIRNYSVPKGVDILFMHEYISRQDSQYVRAKEFIPERWLVSKDDPLHYSSAHPMATMPFGHGVRSCIGRRIAELEVETFLARVIENFEVQWDGPPPTFVTRALNYMVPPYHYIFKDVK